MSNRLDRARHAFERGAWSEAYSSLTAAEEEQALTGRDLEHLAVAAHLVGADEASAAAWERAHLDHLEAGEVEQAVGCAFWLAIGLLGRGQGAQGGGWLGRAHRLVKDHDLDCVQQGFLLLPAGLRAIDEGDPTRARQAFEDAMAVGQRFGDPDLVTLGRLGQGRSLVLMGRVPEGLGLLDEAMVAVTTGEVSPIVAGLVYCTVILVCHQAFDVPRAQEWTAALSAWCEAQPDMVPFRGQCLVHRSEVMQWNGDWPAALDEAKRARDRLSDPPDQPAVGMAFYQLGELYRLRGDLADAEAAYREAANHGLDPQPGLCRLRFMRGEVAAAAASVRRLMDEPHDPRTRAGLLAAAVEILLADGDADTAGRALAELGAIAADVGAPVLVAMARQGQATLLLHQGDPGTALDAAREAASAWAALHAPYDQARSRLLVALACRDLGDGEAAALEAEAARQTLRRLGAAPDLARVDRLFPGSASTTAGNLTAREVEVLALVAAGKTNRAIAAELTVSEHTVRRHLQNIFAKVGVTSRAAATAFAYEHGLV